MTGHPGSLGRSLVLLAAATVGVCPTADSNAAPVGCRTSLEELSLDSERIFVGRITAYEPAEPLPCPAVAPAPGEEPVAPLLDLDRPCGPARTMTIDVEESWLGGAAGSLTLKLIDTQVAPRLAPCARTLGFTPGLDVVAFAVERDGEWWATTWSGSGVRYRNEFEQARAAVRLRDLTLRTEVVDGPVVPGRTLKLRHEIVNASDEPLVGCLGTDTRWTFTGDRRQDVAGWQDWSLVPRCARRLRVLPGKPQTWTETIDVPRSVPPGPVRLQAELQVILSRRCEDRDCEQARLVAPPLTLRVSPGLSGRSTADGG